MEIIYTQNSIEGEPGPNLYWRGNPSEFVQLLIDMHPLGVSSGISMRLEDFKYIRLNGILSFGLSSTDDGKTLIRVEDGIAITELSLKLWREFLHNILSISFLRSFVYQELSIPDQVSGINIIMSSEA